MCDFSIPSLSSNIGSFNLEKTAYETSMSLQRGCPYGIVTNMLDCYIIVSEFKPQSCYYVHFWTNTLAKGMNPLILPAMG